MNAEMEKFPIIFIHNGTQEYFINAIKQARKYNEDARIIVIGDRTKEEYPDFIEFYDVNEIKSERNEEFKKVYKHSSYNGFEYERFCFERWFIIYDLLKKLNLGAFLHLDSDIFLYCNAKEEFEKYKNYDMSICGIGLHNSSGHSAYFSSLKALEGFLDYTMDFYSKENDEFNFYYKKHEKEHDYNYQISDMLLLALYSKHIGERAGELVTYENSSTYDMNINFLTKTYHSNFINFKVENNGDLIAHISKDKNIIFKTLHFQGIAKKYMVEFFDKNEFTITQDLFNKWRGDKTEKFFFGTVTKERMDNRRIYKLFGKTILDYVKK